MSNTKTRRRPQNYKGKTFGPTSDFRVDAVERGARRAERVQANGERRTGTRQAIIRLELKGL